MTHEPPGSSVYILKSITYIHWKFRVVSKRTTERMPKREQTLMTDIMRKTSNIHTRYCVSYQPCASTSERAHTHVGRMCIYVGLTCKLFGLIWYNYTVLYDCFCRISIKLNKQQKIQLFNYWNVNCKINYCHFLWTPGFQIFCKISLSI